MEGKVIEKIAGFKTSATKKEKILIDRLKELDGNVIIHMSITELANKIDIAEATILRFCKKIGYKGYQDFKIALSQDVAFRKVEMNNSLIEKSFNKITSGLEFTINNLDSSMIKEVTKSILHAKKICVFGIGNSYVPTMYFYNALVKKGVNIWVSSDSHIRNMLAVNLTKDDFVILLSSSGKTTEMINLAKICKKTNISRRQQHACNIICNSRAGLIAHGKPCQNPIPVHKAAPQKPRHLLQKFRIQPIRPKLYFLY